MTQKEPIISVKNLSKSFRTRGNKNIFSGWFDPQWKTTNAVKNVSFEVAQGESVAFLGPNGAGKTTTTKIMSGIMYPTSGSVRVMGHVPQERSPDYLRRIGLVMGNKSGLNWDLTTAQSYELLKEIYQLSEEQFALQLEYLKSLLNIEEVMDRQIRQLSLGERMKVELAASLLHEPEILFLDEPTIGLDIDAKYAVREFLITLRKDKNVTIILTSHDMDDIEHVCERVLVVNKGAMIFDDSLSILNKKYANWRYIRLTFEEPIEPNALVNIGKIIDSSERSHLIKVSKKDLVQATGALGALPGLADISIESVPLERIVSDLFKTLK